jgi:NAD(P)H-dependent flavin oxidoreductase YrpB (nitropropane dioxygenase family)
MLGIEYPIIAFSHCRDVIVSVVNAGGFGVLGATGHTPENLDVDLSWIDEHTRGGNYGVDLLYPTKRADVPETSGQASRAELFPEGHRKFVEEMLDRYGVPPLPDDSAEALELRQDRGDGLATGNYEAIWDVALDAHHVKLVASALGPPPPALVRRAHDSGAIVAALAGAPVHAERHVATGVDIVVAQGTEAGGHTGEISTMVLVPQVVDAIAPTPVVAAGGIANGRQVAAAMALGAEGVWCGSVWLTTEEAETDRASKEKFLQASSRDTVRSRSRTGKPARMIRSAWTEEWDRADTPDPLPMPLQSMLVSEANARIRRAAAGHPDSGAFQLSGYFVGQVVGMLDRVRPTRQVVMDMVTEYADAAQRFVDQLDPKD